MKQDSVRCCHRHAAKLALIVTAFSAIFGVEKASGQAIGGPGSIGGSRPPIRQPAAKTRRADRPKKYSEPAGPPVAGIEIIGNRQISSERIISKIATRIGRPYRAAMVRDDVRALYKTHWFYTVAVEEEQTPDGPVITFRVAERPSIAQIDFIGNTVFKDEKLRELTGLRPGTAMDPGLNTAAVRTIEREYRDKGYIHASVELVEGGTHGDSNVVLKINEGPKTKVDAISFEGNEFVGGPRLKTLIDTSAQILSPSLLGFRGKVGQIGIGGKYDPNVLNDDIVKLTDYYKQHGFLDARVGRKLEWTADRSRVRVTFVIEEGERYKVRDVQFAGNKVYQPEDLDAELKLTSGSVVERGAVTHDVQKINDYYGKNGYINASVQPKVRYLDEEGEVDVVYQVYESQPKQIGEVRIRGNEVTKSARIRALVKDLEPGTTADTTELRFAQQRLIESRLFEMDPSTGTVPSVQFDPNNDPSDPYQDVNIDVKESPTGSLLFGVGVNSDAGVGGSIVLHERNFDLFRVPTSWSDITNGRAFRGAMQEFRLEAVPGDRVQRYSATFRDPMLLGSDFSLQTSGYFYKRIFTNYDEERAGGRFTFGKAFSRRVRGSITYRIENVGVSDPIIPTPTDFLPVLGDNFLTSFRFALNHDTRDSHLAPGQGHFIEAGFEQVFGDFEFPKFDIDARQYWTLYSRADGSGKHTLRARLQLGYADEAPLVERFYAGGFQTIRGFDFRGVGPVSLGTEVGGDFMLMGGLEYQLPITADDNLSWVFFVDSGTVEREFEILDYRVAAGFGLRVRVPAFGPVPLAFDFGFPINKASFDDTQVFSFFFGIFQ